MPAESSAIRKLGRLFRLTEVHLWDDYYVTGAGEAHNWHAAETGCTGSWTGKSRDRPAKQTDEDSFVEDMELASLMGSLGLPVSFSTSKEKKNTPIKVEHQGRQASYEPVNTPIDGDVRTCANTEEIASVPKLMACVGHTNSCILSRTDVDSVFGTICCDEIVPGDEGENQCELETCQFHDNMSKTVQSESSVRENQVVDSVMQLNKVMLGQIPVAYESIMTCTELCQEGKLCAWEDQIGGETPCISHDKNDAECKVCINPAEPSPVNNHVEKSCSDFYYEYGDWKVLWDQFYSRYYFYNILTQESTWYTPQGLEDFALHCSTYTSQGMDELVSQYTSQGTDELGSQYTSQGMDELGSKKFDESSGVLSCADNTMDDYISEADQHVTVQYGAQLSACDNGFDKTGADRHLDAHRQDLYKAHNLSDIPDEESINLSVVATIEEAQHDENIQNDRSVTKVLNMHQEVSTTQKKKRVRRSQSYHSCQDLVENISSDIAKYWTQRYSLFSLFDSGIKMDEEGWFSVTPELIAKHHASRVGTGTLIDCFTGVGGNAIQFATQCKHVIAVDIDPQKIGCAQHNATVYGVNDHIDFVVGDFIQIAPHLKGETAFMSPPWGGPDYAKADVYDIKTMLKPCDGHTLFKLATLIASRVVMFLPRNIDLSQLADMCMSVDPPWTVEVEKNFLNGKLKAITAYFEQHDASDVQHY